MGGASGFQGNELPPQIQTNFHFRPHELHQGQGHARIIVPRTA